MRERWRKWRRFLASRCVPDDDPRLKDKQEVHGQARTEMERNRAQAPRRGTYLPDQRGSRFSRNACKPSC